MQVTYARRCQKSIVPALQHASSGTTRLGADQFMAKALWSMANVKVISWNRCIVYGARSHYSNYNVTQSWCMTVETLTGVASSLIDITPAHRAPICTAWTRVHRPCSYSMTAASCHHLYCHPASCKHFKVNSLLIASHAVPLSARERHSLWH